MTNIDLHNLGWKAFQDLGACILKEILGQTVQMFAEGADGGRDGYFTGTWNKVASESFEGAFTLQCKHTSKEGKGISKSVLLGEVEKVKKLVEKGCCDNYIVLTNYICQAEKVLEIEKMFTDVGVKHCHIYGPEWISSTIIESPHLRRLMPRIYGLGDLSQIIDKRAYDQAKEILLKLDDDLSKFVPTESYRQCAEALREFGFVILLGEPASGKSTIANLMALSAADEWKLSTVIVTEPEDIKTHWNPSDPNQFFWVDDAFGVTQYDAQKTQSWNKCFSFLFTAIKNGARAIFTSRDYIFYKAQDAIKISSHPLLDESKVIIQVENFTVEEKQMMIYNHLKLGNQPQEFKTAVKKYLEVASTTSKFLPDVARRLGDSKFTKNIKYNEESVIHFFEHPREVLEEVIRNLAEAERAAIAIVFVNGGNLKSPIEDNEENGKIITLLGVNIYEVKNAISHLNGSFLKKACLENGEVWQFRHPTIRDAYANIIGANGELIDIYLEGVPIDKMINEVTCGNIYLQGAKVIIPDTRFSIVMDKISQLSESKRLYFLATRCSKNFLFQYFNKTRDIDNFIDKIYWLNFSDSHLEIIKKLYDEGYLDEEFRKRVSEQIREIVFERYDPGFFYERNVGRLITEEEKHKLIEDLADRVLPSIKDVIDYESQGWQRGNNPEEPFENLNELLDIFEQHFSNEHILEEISKSRDLIKDKIFDLSYENDHELSPFVKMKAETPNEKSFSVKSIFDDVDE